MRRALAISLLAHALSAGVGWWLLGAERKRTELVDIEVAPPPPKVEALPEEHMRLDEEALAAQQGAVPAMSEPVAPGEIAIDAGVPDAAIDAPLDAAPKRKHRDAGIDAAPDAAIDAAPDAEVDVAAAGSGSAATADAGAGSGSATLVAAADAGAGSGSDTVVAAAGSGSGSGSASTEDNPALDGAPTTAGTAANLLAYFPKGHVVTALIRFDRLRGTEWGDATERLLRPMPDYQLLFAGASDAKLGDKVDTLVISSPRPRDAAATTLVAHTVLGRARLREFLTVQPVAWSAARGGLLGTRGGKLFPGDKRVFLSPFKGWFLLASPDDLPGLTAPARGSLDGVEATAKLPAWVAGIRKIEAESGDGARGPALVLTIGLDGKRLELGDNDYGLGVASAPTPDRVSLAMELVKQGWLVRGNLHFATPAAAAEFVASVEKAQRRIAGSHAIQAVVGKPVARIVANLSLAQSGPRVSYATSISIADARAILAASAAQLDTYFGRAP